jgi:integrase
MARRRAKGEGSIFKTKDSRGNVIWRGKVPVGTNPDGSIKYQFVSGKREMDVKEKVDALKGDVRNNTYAEPNRITVTQWLDTWLNVTIKEAVKDTTWLSYESMIKKHINPAIGGIRLMQLQTSHLQKLYNEKIKCGRADGKEGGLSPRTVRYIHQVINGALKQAVKEKLISVNVSESVRLPKNPKKEMKVLEVENVFTFLETAKNNRYYKRYYAAYLLELYTGVRRGELLGLRWRDIDLKEGNVHVVQQLVKVGSKHEIRELKTESSQNRVISIPGEIIDVLKVHKKVQEEYLSELGFNDLQIKEQSKPDLFLSMKLVPTLYSPGTL